jgi:hypothetical protein
MKMRLVPALVLLGTFALAACSIIAPKEQQLFKVSCGKGSVQPLLNEGWKVVSTNERQIQCGSRSEVTGYRDIVFGSQVTKQPIGFQQVPIMGTETEYILEK